MNDIFETSQILNDFEKNYLGIVSNIQFPSNDDSYINYIIENKDEFRPDKIAFRFYGNEKLSWIIDEVNNFFSIKEYYGSRKIKILKTEILELLKIG